MVRLLDVPCDSCGGRHYRRTALGWARCDACWPTLLNLTYIKPSLRQGEQDLPPEILAVEPWPLTSRVEGGSYDAFRRQVWRSLLHYYDTRRLGYEYLTAWRLNEIFFGRDAEYASLAAIYALDLVILVVGIADLPNTMLPQLIQNVQRSRQMEGQPTWTYRGTGAPTKPISIPSGSTTLSIRDVTR